MLSRRHGPSQHGRNRRAREALPLNTFYTRRQLPADTRHIALLDDVVTTGSTMRVMAHTMQSAGVRRIDIWAPCRAALQ
jgi:predicted amidophosphoribosyltransferase